MCMTSDSPLVDTMDGLIQRLFATGLELEATARSAAGRDASERIHRAVDELDIAVHHIRSVIAALPTARAGRRRITSP